MSTWHPDRWLTGWAWDAITAACLLRRDGPPRRVLLLGLGGGTVVRQLVRVSPGTHVTGVDLDPAMADWARTKLAHEPVQLTVHVADAYRHLALDPRHYDVVIDDVYVAGATDVRRPQPVDAILVAALRRRLASGGVLVINLVTGPGHRTQQSLARRSVRAAFDQVATVRPARGHNEVLAAGWLADRSPLAGLTDAWPARERGLWRKLRVKRLSPPRR